jgi:hypothetical protein
MALHYEYRGTEDTSKWTDQDWQMYKNLAWITAVISISYLCEESADEFVRRMNLLKPLIMTDEEGNVVEADVEMLRPYFGLSTNATNRTGDQWAKVFCGNKKADNFWVDEIEELQATAENELVVTK